MAITRVATLTLASVALLALAACSGLSGLGSDCTVCETPAAAPAPMPAAQRAPAPVAAQNAGARPPEARPGEVWCYVRVPAVTRTVTEQVCVQPATCTQKWVEPVYNEVEETVCVKPAETRQIPIPAEFETVTEQVMVAPAKTEWRRVECEPESLGSGEQVGECWTLCEVPPVYECRTRQVCVRPESCREETIPPVYETRTKTVCVQEGYYEQVEVPPVYETVTREELVAPARWEWRRTTECEVPDAVCPPGMDPMGMAPAPSQPATGMGTPDAGSWQPEDAPMDDTLPPAGTLPEADPFAPSR